MKADTTDSPRPRMHEPMAFKRIPKALRDVNTWVTWRYAPKPNADGWTKIPSAPGRPYINASSTNPLTWNTYENAKHWFDRHEARGGDYVFDGLGFMLTTESGIVGIDLDHCVNKETYEIAEWAMQLIREITPAPYVELSPSHGGLHVYVKSHFPENHHSKIDSYEFYSKARFLTITGHLLDGSAVDVPEIDPAVMKKLHDRIFKAKIEKAQLEEAESKRRMEAFALDRAQRAASGLPERPNTENGWPLAYARKACESALKDMTDGAGKRHDKLIKSSLKLAGLAAGGCPGAEQALDELRATAIILMPGRTSEVDRVIKGARTKAKPASPPVPKDDHPFEFFQPPQAYPTLITTALPTVEETVSVPVPQRKEKEKLPINWEAFNMSRAAMWATLADPSLSKIEKTSIHRMATCHVGEAVATCNAKPCNHTHHRSRACQRFPCPSCGVRQRKNYIDAIKCIYAGKDADLVATTGQAGIAWYFEIETGPSFADIAPRIEKAKKQIPAKLRERAMNFTRWGRSPDLILAWTRDEHTAEVLAAALNQPATKVTTLAGLVGPIGRVFDRRHAREIVALRDYVKIFEKHGHKLVKPGYAFPDFISKELSDELRASEWRRWTARTPISTAGKDAQANLHWPDAGYVTTFARDKTKQERLDNGDPELVHSWDCSKHGDDVTWHFKKDSKSQLVPLVSQPERGKPPTWKEVFASDPYLSRYG